MQLREGESVGDYISRLEQRLRQLEPPEGFTVQEWHIGQVYAFMLWRDDDVRKGNEAALQRWSDGIDMFEKRFPEATKKFADYMGWNKDKPAN